MVPGSVDRGVDALEACDVRDLGLDLGAQSLQFRLRQVEGDGQATVLPRRAPAADHDPVLEDHRPDPAASPLLHVGRVLGVDREGAVLPAEQVGVEVAAHPDLARGGQSRTPAARLEHRLLPNPDLLDLTRDRLQSGSDIPKWEPGPVGEVAVSGRRERPDVAPRELGQRAVAVEGRWLADPVLAADQAAGLAAVRPKAGDPARHGQTDDVEPRVLIELHARFDHTLRRLRSSQRALVGEGLGDHPQRLVLLPRRHAQLGEPPPRPLLDPRLEDRQPPTGVLRRDQMDRRAHHPGAKQRAVLRAGPSDVLRRQRAAARAEGLGARVDVLSLSTGDRPRDLNGILRGNGTVEQLPRRSPSRQLRQWTFLVRARCSWRSITWAISFWMLPSPLALMWPASYAAR